MIPLAQASSSKRKSHGNRAARRTIIAPERAAGACYGCEADAWALGVTLVAVWTGRLPLVPGNGGLFAFAALVCDSNSAESGLLLLA